MYEDMLRLYNTDSYKNSALQETGQCGNRCYIFIGDEGLLLDVGESYVDPKNPCEPYVCKVSTDAQKISIHVISKYLCCIYVNRRKV